MIEINKGRKPVGCDKTGVAGNKEGAVEDAVYRDSVEIYVDVFGGDEVWNGFCLEFYSCPQQMAVIRVEKHL